MTKTLICWAVHHTHKHGMDTYLIARATQPAPPSLMLVDR